MNTKSKNPKLSPGIEDRAVKIIPIRLKIINNVSIINTPIMTQDEVGINKNESEVGLIRYVKPHNNKNNNPKNISNIPNCNNIYI
jgi:hypothetical protein